MEQEMNILPELGLDTDSGIKNTGICLTVTGVLGYIVPIIHGKTLVATAAILNSDISVSARAFDPDVTTHATAYLLGGLAVQAALLVGIGLLIYATVVLRKR